jgi:hypothetical protein
VMDAQHEHIHGIARQRPIILARAAQSVTLIWADVILMKTRL